MFESVCQKKLRKLLKKYLSGKASPEEMCFVEEYYRNFREAPAENVLPEEATDLPDKFPMPTRNYTSPVIALYNNDGVKAGLAAAVFLLLIVIGWFLLLRSLGDMPADIVTNVDRVPSQNQAVRTLANGQKLALDAHTGGLAAQGGTAITNMDGQLVYHAGKVTSEVVYNRLTTPKGQKYQLQLADGTRVWLNTASSIRFPAVFNGIEIKVEECTECHCLEIRQFPLSQHTFRSCCPLLVE